MLLPGSSIEIAEKFQGLQCARLASKDRPACSFFLSLQSSGCAANIELGLESPQKGHSSPTGLADAGNGNSWQLACAFLLRSHALDVCSKATACVACTKLLQSLDQPCQSRDCNTAASKKILCSCCKACCVPVLQVHTNMVHSCEDCLVDNGHRLCARPQEGKPLLCQEPQQSALSSRDWATERSVRS